MSTNDYANELRSIVIKQLQMTSTKVVGLWSLVLNLTDNNSLDELSDSKVHPSPSLSLPNYENSLRALDC